MNILVHNTNIIAVNPVDTGAQWETPDQIIPKNVAVGAAIVDVTLPSDYAPGKYTFNAGVFTLIPESSEVSERKKTEHNTKIDAEILALEVTQHRAVREAALNQEGAAGRLTALDTKIATLRGQRE